jgi:hypothetical protein
VAGGLAILDDRPHVTRDDWRLAGVIWETSCAVRNLIADYGRQLERTQERDETRQQVRRARAIERAVQGDEAQVERVARVIARGVTRNGTSAAKRDLRDATASRDRRYLERAIAWAVRHQLLAETDDGRYAAGRGTP